MIKINKDFCIVSLSSIAELNPSISLVVKDSRAGEYVNGDEVGLASKTVYQHKWIHQSNNHAHTCSIVARDIKWVSSRKEPIEIVGYFVFNETSVLFYDIFRESVVLEYNQPFQLSPCLTMKYDPMDENFPDIGD